jgi:hypothetical protein
LRGEPQAISIKRRRSVDILTIALCMSIGCAVAWLMALYTEAGMRPLIWNVALGMVGAALCALVTSWIEPIFVILTLITVGPVCSLLMIIVGQTIKRRLSKAT